MSNIVKNSIKADNADTVTRKGRNHDNDPFVVKKVEEATKTLQRVGLPKTNTKA